MAHCNQCGFDWQPRVANPTVCTRCKRYDWRESKKGRVLSKESSVVFVPTPSVVRQERSPHATNCHCLMCKGRV